MSIVTADVQSEITRPLPIGVTFSRMPSFTQSGKTAENVRAHFSKEYRKEAAALKQRGGFSSEQKRATLQALVASAHVARYIKQLDEFSSPTPLVICSCRYNHLAYAGVLVKKAREAQKIGTTCAVVRCHRKDMEAPLPLSVCVDEGADGIYCGGETAHTQYVSRSAHFPCGEGEDFIGQELPFLAERFQVSIVTADVQSEITRPLPIGVTFSRMPSFTQSGKTAENVRAHFSKEYRKEAAALKQRGGFSSEQKRATLQALVASAHVARYIKQLDEFSSPTPLVICSCRYNHLAYAGVLVKKAREAQKIGTTCAVVRCHRKDMEAPLPLSVCVDEGADGIYCGGETAHTQYVSR